MNDSVTKAAIARARQEVDEEKMTKSVAALKAKLKELDAAKTVVANIEREIADLELRIEQGNA